jgi:hypothetical protein
MERRLLPGGDLDLDLDDLDNGLLQGDGIFNWLGDGVFKLELSP